MKARMVILAAGAALAVAGSAAQTGGAAGTRTAPVRAQLSGGTQSPATHAAVTRSKASTRAARLLHNPGLPAWIP